MLDINDGSIKSTIAFYNFGTAGESEIDHVVGAQTFPDTVIPEIVYLADDRLAAFSDTGVILFEGSQKPKQSGTIPFEKEVKSIFYNDNYIGCVISNEDEAVTHHISVYDLDGKAFWKKILQWSIQVWNFLRTMRFVLQMKTHVIYTPYMGYINSIMSLNRHCIRSFRRVAR